MKNIVYDVQLRMVVTYKKDITWPKINGEFVKTIVKTPVTILYIRKLYKDDLSNDVWSEWEEVETISLL